MSGLLDRPGDRESPDEERLVQKLSRRQIQILNDIKWRLERSAIRTAEYLSALNLPEYARERRIQDRLLAELSAQVPALQVTLPPEDSPYWHTIGADPRDG